MKSLNIKTIALLSVAVLAGTEAKAQSQSTYFLDNYSYNYRLNPAIMAERSFLGVGVGTVDLTAGSNLGLSSLLFPSSDGTRLVTGLNGSVSSEEFLSGIKDVNDISTGLNYNIFSIGVRKEKTMTTVELNFRTAANANISGDLFRLLKNGTAENYAYDLSSTSVNLNAYLELAFGRSRINEENTLGWGYRLKGLLGLAGGQVNFNDTQIAANPDYIGINANATGRLAAPLVKFKVDDKGTVTGLEADETSTSPAGYGAALDAGIVWKPIEGLSLTAGVTDLGLVSWRYNLLAETNGEIAYTGCDLSEDEVNVSEEFEKIGEEFTELANLKAKDGSESELSMLPFTVNLGARYQMPFAKCISVGALATYRNAVNPYIDARLGATLSPCKWFSLTGNYGYGSRGAVCGGAMSVSLFFLNLFVAVDGYSGPIGLYEGSIPYPVDKFNFRVNCGLTLQFGKSFSK